MKKLMIAAASAAMIGGSYAAPAVVSADYAYNFTASLKTTAGVKGKAVTVNLGVDSLDEFWYRDASITYTNATGAATGDGPFFGQVTFADGSDSPIIFQKDTEDGKGVITSAFDTLTNNQKMEVLNMLIAYADPKVGGYGEKSAKQWCASFTYNLCYRKASTKKLSYVFETSDCCASSDDAGFSLTDLAGSAFAIDSALYHRFGADTIAKSTKVEFVGELTDGTAAALGDVYYFALAGQGTWSDKLAKDSNGLVVSGVSAISGNIVGAISAVCPNCCTDPDAATAFYCDGTLADSSTCTGGDASHTAAYGTFTIKFNKSKSFK